MWPSGDVYVDFGDVYNSYGDISPSTEDDLSSNMIAWVISEAGEGNAGIVFNPIDSYGHLLDGLFQNLSKKRWLRSPRTSYDNEAYWVYSDGHVVSIGNNYVFNSYGRKDRRSQILCHIAHFAYEHLEI